MNCPRCQKYNSIPNEYGVYKCECRLQCSNKHYVDSLYTDKYCIFFDRNRRETRIRNAGFITVLVLHHIKYDINDDYVDRMLLLK